MTMYSSAPAAASSAEKNKTMGVLVWYVLTSQQRQQCSNASSVALHAWSPAAASKVAPITTPDVNVWCVLVLTQELQSYSIHGLC